MTPASAFVAPGTVIGPYFVERRLAQGVASVLYVARDGGGARVALKVVAPGAAGGAGRARLAREARALAAVAHPGIARAHGAGEHEGMAWLATELVQGQDLRRVLAERGPMRPEDAVRGAAHLAEALAAVHQAGVVHRDVEPSNVLVASDGRIVLAGFGLARRRVEPRESDVSAVEREALGAPAYLSPEQIEHGLADERSDVWALGCVLYEMIEGAPPFGRGGAATTASILRDEPSISAGAGPAGDVISACLRKSSFARIASAREVAALLRAALEGRREPDDAGRARPQRASARPSRPPSVPPPRPRLSSIPPPWASPLSSGSMRAAAPQGRVKGAAVRAALVWFADAYGNAALTRAYDLASPELKAMLRPSDPAYGVMASTWYETALVGELVDLMESVASPDDADDHRARLAMAVAKDNVGGVYRSLFRLVATPSLLEANAQRVWGTYVNEGAFVVRVVRPGGFEARLRGWSAHHAGLCRLGAHLLEQFLRTIGYGGLVVERTQCVATEDGQCVFEGTWLP